MKDGYRESRDRQGWGIAIGCPVALILWFAFGSVSFFAFSWGCAHTDSPGFFCTKLGSWIVLAAHLLTVLAIFGVVRWMVDRVVAAWRDQDE